MGRSVAIPRNTIEVAYIDLADYEIEDNYSWHELCFDIRCRSKDQWPSLKDTSRWIGNECEVLLENSFCEIGVSCYGNLAAIWLRSKKDDNDYYYYEYIRLLNLADNWCNKIAGKFEAMFGKYRKIGVASNGEAFFEKI